MTEPAPKRRSVGDLADALLADSLVEDQAAAGETAGVRMMKLFLRMQEQQQQQLQQQMHHQMQFMNEQMKTFLAAGAVQAAQRIEAASASSANVDPNLARAAAKSFGFDEMEFAEGRTLDWGKALLQMPDEKSVDSRDMAVVRSAGSEFRKKLHSLMNADARVEKLADDMKESEKGKVPSGYKPFQVELRELSLGHGVSICGPKIRDCLPSGLHQQ